VPLNQEYEIINEIDNEFDEVKIDGYKLRKKYQHKFLSILDKSDPDYRDKGDVLELFIALKSKESSKECTILYDDVPIAIKDKYQLTYKDTGIDLIRLDLESNRILEIIQCKNYSRRLSHHKLGTFYYWILKLHEIDSKIKSKLVINDKTRYNGNLMGLDVEVVSNEDIYNYLSILPDFSFSTFWNFNFDFDLDEDSEDSEKYELKQNEVKIIIDPDRLNEIDEVCYEHYFDSNEYKSRSEFEKMLRRIKWKCKRYVSSHVEMVVIIGLMLLVIILILILIFK